MKGWVPAFGCRVLGGVADTVTHQQVPMFILDSIFIHERVMLLGYIKIIF